MMMMVNENKCAEIIYKYRHSTSCKKKGWWYPISLIVFLILLRFSFIVLVIE